MPCPAQIFVSDNNGADQTVVERLTCIGAPLLTTDMQKFKPVDPSAFYMDAEY